MKDQANRLSPLRHGRAVCRLALSTLCLAIAVLAWAPGTTVATPFRSLARRPYALGGRALTLDPVLAGQWFLSAIHAFDFWPTPPPSLVPVRVAVLDSGIDGSHPDFKGRIAVSRSFVGGSPLVDQVGHGTMVAGEILAAAGERPNGQATLDPVQLLVGKIVSGDQTIDVNAEAEAIRWAADQGARVINLSLGARRDPLDATLDQYSPVEDAAVQYAYRKGALVVAATGNCESVCPYGFASYPAALSHVLAVSAVSNDGSTPAFSNRDPRRNDVAAPGVGIVSTFPLDLSMPGCAEPGYSSCASDPDFRAGDGTSFAAPLASAAAALLFAVQPSLTAGQVMSILEHTADPPGGSGHNPESGYGRLDIANALRALAGPLPPANSHTGVWAGTGVLRLGGRRNVIRATLDYYDDPLDVYSIYVRPGEQLAAEVSGQVADGVLVTILPPGTKRLRILSPRQLADRALVRAGPAPNISFTYRARTAGWYDLELRAIDGSSGSYRLLVRIA